MSEVSFGSVAPKNRSINVGANLLGEWTAEQARRRRQVGRYAFLLGASLLLALAALPGMLGAARVASEERARLRKSVADLDASLAGADREQKAAQPSVVVGAMDERSDASLVRFLAQIDQAFGAVNSHIALASLRAEAKAGEIHLVVLGDAEDGDAADSFARHTGEEGSKVDGIVNSHPSALLGAGGIGFQYEKRIEVKP